MSGRIATVCGIEPRSAGGATRTHGFSRTHPGSLALDTSSPLDSKVENEGGKEFSRSRGDTMTFLNLSLGSPIVRAGETVTGEMGVVGARFIMAGGPSGGRFSLVEHPIVPRGLAAPFHVHAREDEFSFVLEGRWGFQLGVDVVYAETGDLVYKPRDVWHTFWNATDEPARLLEIISPAGFEQLFVELSDLLRTDPGNLEAAAAWARGTASRAIQRRPRGSSPSMD